VAIARPVSDMGVKPGDFVMGQAGTRYLIIADPGEPHLGLRYMQANGTSIRSTRTRIGGSSRWRAT
jgi:hypothetical protein